VRELALDAIAQHTPADLITHRYPVEEATQAFQVLGRSHSSGDEEAPLQIALTY
jgi:threonine dehydrogenase-like Zn-dependent dehydrogenase